MRSKTITIRISEIIHLWDPIGHTPSDEYDDLALKIYSKYSKDNATESIARFLREYLTNHVGLSEIDGVQLIKTADLIYEELRRFQLLK